MLTPSNLFIIHDANVEDVAKYFSEWSKGQGYKHLPAIHVTEDSGATLDDFVSGFKYIDKKIADKKHVFGIFAPQATDIKEQQKIIERAAMVAMDNPHRQVFVIPFEKTPEQLYRELPYCQVRFASLHLSKIDDVQNLDGGREEANRVFHFPSSWEGRPKHTITVGGDPLHKVEFVDLDKFFKSEQSIQSIQPPRALGLG